MKICNYAKYVMWYLRSEINLYFTFISVDISVSLCIDRFIE